MTPKPVLACALGLAALVALSVAAAQSAPQASHPPPTPPASQKPAAQVHSEGERIFAQNCARCHTAPDGFSPHISGTIVLHMRVRASLSKHDEEELLRFFNP